MTDAVIPQNEELSTAIELELYDSGGHVGFVAGRHPWNPDYWLENRILDFVQIADTENEWDAEILRRLSEIDAGTANLIDRKGLQRRIRARMNRS